MFFYFLYDIALFFLALLALPRFAYQLIFRGKYRKSFFARLGGVALKEREGKKLIFIHAVSLGETKAIVPLVKRLKEKHPSALFVVSSITETGHEEARRSLSFADQHIFLPYDFSFLMRPLIKRLRPDLVVIAETDFWLNFLRFAKAQHARIVVVNGKMSEKTEARHRLFPPFAKRLFALIDLFLVQSAEYGERFLHFLVPPSKISVTGNLKFDVTVKEPTPEEKAVWRDKLSIKLSDPTILLASTHEGEEQLLIPSILSLREQFPTLKVVVAPRHPERFALVAKKLEKMNYPVVEFSKMPSVSVSDNQVILFDVMGKLSHIFPLVDCAVIGGSFVEGIGGHNILEPLYFETPVFFGPYMHKQKELVALVDRYGAGLKMDGTKVRDALLELLTDEKKRRHLKERGRTLLAESRGSLEKTFSGVESLVQF